MNRDCRGDWFPSLHRYRYLASGAFVQVESLPAICPECLRDIDCRTFQEVRTRTVTVIHEELEMPSGVWVEFERKAG